jgi:hypothetical protein
VGCMVRSSFLKSRFQWMIGLGILTAQGLGGAISIDSYSSAANDRFANSPSFLLDGFDLSGVGLANTSQSLDTWDDGGRWVTMLSSNVFISADHFPPIVGSPVTFYASNDPSGGTATRTVASAQQLGSTDFWLGTLNAPLGANYASYDIVTGDITLDINGNPVGPGAVLGGQTGYLFGRSPDTEFPISQDMAIGENVIDFWFGETEEDGRTTDSIGTVVNASGEGNYRTYEARLIAGDSGGPLFVEDGSGGLDLVGINWFVADSSGTFINGMSYVGNYDEQIQAYIDANAVPEPSWIAALVGMAALATALVRRRR